MNSFLLSIKYYLIGFSSLLLSILVIWYIFFSSLNTTNYNQYKVVFNKVNNLTPDTPVVLYGYKVGFVKKIYLNKDFNPIVVIYIKKKISIPEDSSLSIKEKDIVGHKVLQLNLGIDNDSILYNQDTIYNSNEGLSLVNILDMLIGYISSKLKGT
ncbi:MlaD family protein [Rickettsiales bacterium LUAb2]